MSTGIFVKHVDLKLVNKVLSGKLKRCNKVDVDIVTAKEKISGENRIFCGYFTKDNIELPTTKPCNNCYQIVGKNPVGVPLKLTSYNIGNRDGSTYTLHIVDCERLFCDIRCAYTFLKYTLRYSPEEKEAAIDILKILNCLDTGNYLLEKPDPLLLNSVNEEIDSKTYCTEEATKFKSTDEIRWVPIDRLFKK